jgi:hypothetical protein
MANTIKHKRGTTTPTAGQLVVGEIAINTSTGAAFTKTDGGSVVALNSNNPVFTGNVTAGTNLVSNYSAGDEGGEIQLAKPATNSTLAGTVSIDIYQNRLRFFENGGNARGAYIDITACTNGVASNLLSGGATSASWGSITGTLSSQTDLNTALGLKAPLASPTFTGTVTIPAGASISGFAPLASPTFTGTPTAPTATTATNSTQVATTAYVKNNLSSYVTTSYLTSTLASYTPTASLNSNLIPTNVVNEFATTIYSSTGHTNAIVTFDTESATSHDYYIMSENSVSMPNGTQIVLIQKDSYSATIHADTGVTLYSRGSRFTMNGQYAVATLVKIAYDTWVLSGDLV